MSLTVPSSEKGELRENCFYAGPSLYPPATPCRGEDEEGEKTRWCLVLFVCFSYNNIMKQLCKTENLINITSAADGENLPAWTSLVLQACSPVPAAVSSL